MLGNSEPFNSSSRSGGYWYMRHPVVYINDKYQSRRHSFFDIEFHYLRFLDQIPVDVNLTVEKLKNILVSLTSTQICLFYTSHVFSYCIIKKCGENFVCFQAAIISLYCRYKLSDYKCMYTYITYMGCYGCTTQSYLT